jgi:hypothetical protein
MAKNFDPKAKAKRQKVIAAVGGVILLGLLAFQVPRTMKMLHPEDPPDEPVAAATTTTGGATPLAPPTLSGGGGTGGSLASSGSPSASGDGIVDPDTLPSPASGQLLSFSRFKSKDPFHQQVKDCAVEACDAAAPTSTGKPATGAGGGAGTTGLVPGSSGASGAGTPTSSKPQGAAALPVRRARISVGGVAEVVSVGKTFPAADPAFKLVSLTRTKAMIAIAGGSFESGAGAIALVRGRTVTLLNTADGTRYVLKLLATSP